jgi:hypothetical protein
VVHSFLCHLKELYCVGGLAWLPIRQQRHNPDIYVATMPHSPRFLLAQTQFQTQPELAGPNAWNTGRKN